MLTFKRLKHLQNITTSNSLVVIVIHSNYDIIIVPQGFVEQHSSFSYQVLINSCFFHDSRTSRIWGLIQPIHVSSCAFHFPLHIILIKKYIKEKYQVFLFQFGLSLDGFSFKFLIIYLKK